MYAVAITRQTETPQDALAPMAELVGSDLYGMRLRLSGPLPIIAGNARDADQATQWLATARALGYGAVAVDLDRVPSGGAIMTARSFELQPDAFAIVCDDGRETRVPHAETMALIHAMLASESETVTHTTEKKFSAGRALATGGLSRNKTTTQQTRAQAQEHEPALYLVRKSGTDPIILRQNRMVYDGLGAPLPPTRLACFRALIDRLREATPGALFDDRLLSQKRKPDSVEQARDQTVAGKSRTQSSTITQTNQGATDLAAYLIAVAHLRGQL